MGNFNDGDVIICSSGQAGTIAEIIGKDAWVLLANRDIWVGSLSQCRYPQDQADLDAAPLHVERTPAKMVRPERD